MTVYMRPYRLGVFIDPTRPDMQPIRWPVVAQPFPFRLQPPQPKPLVRPPFETNPLVVHTMPAVVPIQQVPTSDGTTPISQPGVNAPATPTVIVTPTSGTIPPPTTPIVASRSGSIMEWLQGSMFGGIPNWVIAAGAGLFLFGGGGRKRR